MIHILQRLVDATMKDMHDVTQRLLRSEMAMFAQTVQLTETAAHFENVTAMQAEFVAQLDTLQQQIVLKAGKPIDHTKKVFYLLSDGGSMLPLTFRFLLLFFLEPILLVEILSRR
eukprot:TRINITY_DN8225_c0_g1_i3.p1 TRINITY_DN8225_c0_g1~~TRINITY_DN8225_c0_g1_i3.p1  ORF type:complete len:115 (-),score=15.66 TRINITY_DN8225_c0_g1_i3:397-741(-)